MAKYIDLNSDLGESYGVYDLGADEDMIKLISSANIACGFHAGDPNVMNRTVAMAKAYNVGVGAHPGYQDLIGFGRRNMDVDSDEIKNLIIYQAGALHAFCERHGMNLQHIKPHGALGNLADANEPIASCIVESLSQVYCDVPFLVKPNSAMYRAVKSLKVPYVLEVYADRAYNSDLSLVSRKVKGAVIHDPKVAVQRVIRMLTEGRVVSIQGEEVPISCQSICVHGDTPDALKMIQKLRHALGENGYTIRSFSKQ